MRPSSFHFWVHVLMFTVGISQSQTLPVTFPNQLYLLSGWSSGIHYSNQFESELFTKLAPCWVEPVEIPCPAKIASLSPWLGHLSPNPDFATGTFRRILDLYLFPLQFGSVKLVDCTVQIFLPIISKAHVHWFFYCCTFSTHTAQVVGLLW